LQIDRRRFKRHQLELPIKFRIYLPSRPDTSSTFLSAQLNDLSQTGMRIMTNIVQSGSLHIFHPDPTTPEQAHLEIEVPDGEQTLTLIGRVVWYDQNTEEHPYSFRAGIAFVDIGSEDQKRIQSLIKREQSTPSPASSDPSSPASSD
jgi:c-di-GMP-binding flagellar brake protein YcgR